MERCSKSALLKIKSACSLPWSIKKWVWLKKREQQNPGCVCLENVCSTSLKLLTQIKCLLRTITFSYTKLTSCSHHLKKKLIIDTLNSDRSSRTRLLNIASSNISWASLYSKKLHEFLQVSKKPQRLHFIYISVDRCWMIATWKQK